jgi:hypothetical protein
MAKAKTKKRNSEQELDSVYVLKLIFFMILGSLWLKITKGETLQIPIPVGFIVGLFFAAHEHFSIDRKIEYAVMLVALLVGFWMPFGVYLNF